MEMKRNLYTHQKSVDIFCIYPKHIQSEMRSLIYHKNMYDKTLDRKI